MFVQFSHKGSWSESLNIFLFYSLYILKQKLIEVTIKNYDTFELKDTYIKNYNQWVNKGCIGKEFLEQWLEANKDEVFFFKEKFGVKFKPKVELWSDRKKTEYYKGKLQASFEFENYVEALFKNKFNIKLGPFITPEGQYYEGENELGIEIKNDTLIKKYGNVYIEYAEKSKASNTSYVAAGILKNDKTNYFLIGDKDDFWIFRKKRLVEIYHEEVALKKQGKQSQRGIKFKQIATSKGMAYPLKYANYEALTLDELVEEIKF